MDNGKGAYFKGLELFLAAFFREHHKKLCSSPMWCHHLGEEHSVVVVVVGKKEPLVVVVVVVVWKKKPLVGLGRPLNKFVPPAQPRPISCPITHYTYTSRCLQCTQYGVNETEYNANNL